MRPVFHALNALGQGEDAEPLLAYAHDQPWMADLASSVADVSVAAGAGPYEPGDDRLLATLNALYAASRVRDVLLLPHQPPATDAARDLDAALERAQPVHRAVPVAVIVAFFARMGCRPVVETVFDPVLHEIVVCEAAEDPNAPIEVREVFWPALVVNELVFTRAGVRVVAGRHHAVPGVADRSTLHWEYWRRHRPTSDGSFWWGHNSQWKTELRRDYVTAAGNVYDLDAMSAWQQQLRTRLLPEEELGPLSQEQVELVTHRCRLRNPAEPEFDYLGVGIDARR